MLPQGGLFPEGLMALETTMGNSSPNMVEFKISFNDEDSFFIGSN